eukprot:scaffold3877_cov40-Skeletonema_menzelii.AAC.1
MDSILGVNGLATMRRVSLIQQNFLMDSILGVPGLTTMRRESLIQRMSRKSLMANQRVGLTLI